MGAANLSVLKVMDGKIEELRSCNERNSSILPIFSRPWVGVGVGEISRQNNEIHPSLSTLCISY
jgi:hypothetical protein